MGTTTGTVKSQAARALRRLADVMTNADLAEARNHRHAEPCSGPVRPGKGEQPVLTNRGAGHACQHIVTPAA